MNNKNCSEINVIIIIIIIIILTMFLIVCRVGFGTVAWGSGHVGGSITEPDI